MSKFKYCISSKNQENTKEQLNDPTCDDGLASDPSFREIAYQLKRIADTLEILRKDLLTK